MEKCDRVEATHKDDANGRVTTVQGIVVEAFALVLRDNAWTTMQMKEPTSLGRKEINLWPPQGSKLTVATIGEEAQGMKKRAFHNQHD